MSEATTPGDVGSKWNVLRAGQTDSDGLEIPSLPLPVGTEAGPVRLAVGPNGEARLLLPLSRHERLGTIEAGAALQIGVTTLMHRGRAAKFLDIMCLSRELEPVFDEVVDGVLARIAANVGSVDAVRTTIEDFRALLVTPIRQEIERSRVAGLVAELLILNRLLDLSTAAWRTWRGPDGDRHDFRARGYSLEVKASLRAGTTEITINGLEQLEPPSGGGTLHLAHFVLEPVEGGLLTVSALGGQALAKANDPGRLRELLALVGCADTRDPEWNQHSFRIEKERLYWVSAEFPRIAPSSFASGIVPPGVVDATYRIDLAFAAGSECPAADFDAILRTMAT